MILTRDDLTRIAAFFGVSRKILFKKKLVTYTIDANTGFMHPVINNRASAYRICPFLKSEGGERLCSIHSARPIVCRLFPFSYNPESEELSLPGENCERCPGCEATSEPPGDELKVMLKELTAYRKELSTVIASGMNIFDIKGKPGKRKEFFKLQEEWFES